MSRNIWEELFDDEPEEPHCQVPQNPPENTEKEVEPVKKRESDLKSAVEKIRKSYKTIQDDKRKRTIKLIEPLPIPFVKQRRHSLFKKRSAEMKKVGKSGARQDPFDTYIKLPEKTFMESVKVDTTEFDADLLLQIGVRLNRGKPVSPVHIKTIPKNTPKGICKTQIHNF